MHIKPEDKKKIDKFLEGCRDQFVKLGQDYFNEFGYDEKKDRISTQVRNLQQNVCSASSFSDIEDFIKNQMGKSKGNGPPKEWLLVGDKSLKQLEELRSEATKIAGGDQQTAMAVRLALARGWMRTVVSEYLYQKALDQMGEKAHV